jgi:hypothetical protein
MAEKGFKHKLTAVLSADVKGYSRLIGEDERSTVRTLCPYFTSTSFKLIKFNNGGHKNEMSKMRA